MACIFVQILNIRVVGLKSDFILVFGVFFNLKDEGDDMKNFYFHYN